MIRIFGVALIVLAAFTSYCKGVVTCWNPITWGCHQTILLQTRWYNIEDKPLWIEGQKPTFSIKKGYHIITLHPGEYSLIFLPPTSFLRLAASDLILVEDLEIEFSFDGRAFVPSQCFRPSPKDLIVYNSNLSPLCIRIRRPTRFTTSIELGVFASMQETIALPSFYRTPIPLRGTKVTLPRDYAPLLHPFVLLNPGDELQFNTEGPTWVELVVYSIWPTTEPLKQHILQLIRISLDGNQSEVLPIIATYDRSRYSKTQTNYIPVSYPAFGYIQIPPNKHTIAIQTTTPILIAGYALDIPPALVTKLNLPFIDCQSHTNPVDGSHATLIFKNYFEKHAPLTLSKLYGIEKISHSLILDNTSLDSGAIAADLLWRFSELFPNHNRLSFTASKSENLRMFWREILPTYSPNAITLEMAYLVRPIIHQEPFKEYMPIVNPTFRQIQGHITIGRFLPVPQDSTNGILYELPDRAFNSKLLIAIACTNETTFSVQLEDKPPIPITVSPAPPKSILYEPSLPIGTSRVIEYKFTQFPTQIPLFSLEFDLPLNWIQAAYTELPLPKDVKKIRVWQDRDRPPVYVSIAYKADKPLQLNQTTLLHTLKQLDHLSKLKLLTPQNHSQTFANQVNALLAQHFHPIRKLIETHWRNFTNSLEINLPSHTNQQTDNASELIHKAQYLEETGYQIEALKLWNALLLVGQSQVEAMERITQLLNQLKEHYLAMRYARSAIFITPSNSVPTIAIQILKSNALATQDYDELEQLQCVLFLKNPSTETLSDLAKAFYINGREEYFLSVGLLLPPESQPLPEMLVSATRLNWWSLFDSLVHQLQNSSEKSYWLGIKSLTFYDFAAAEQHLSVSGESGRKLLDHLRKGLNIRKSLGSSNLAERIEGLLAWEDWYANTPGPWLWYDAPELIKSFAAGELVYNPERNIYTTFFRAESNAPITIQCLGPTRLKLEIRPLLSPTLSDPIDTWIELTEYDLTNKIPISSCIPTPTLQLTSKTNELVGQKAVRFFETGPGLHEIIIRPHSLPMLIRVYRFEPALQTGILPAPDPEKFFRLLENPLSLNSKPPRKIKTDNQVWLVPTESCREIITSPHKSFSFKPPETWLNDKMHSLPSSVQLRLALRLPNNNPPFSLTIDDLKQLPHKEQWFAIKKWRLWDMADHLPPQNVPISEKVCMLINQHRLQEAVKLLPQVESPKQLWFWLELAEFYPDLEPIARTYGLFYLQTNFDASAYPDSRRLTKNCRWTIPPDQPNSSAIKPIPFPLDATLEPSMRVRMALLPPKQPGWIDLTANRIFTLTLTITNETELKIEAQPLSVGFLPFHPTSIAIKLNNTTNYVTITNSTAPLEWSTTLPAGLHVVSVWITNPIANQVVRIKPSTLQKDRINSPASIPFDSLAETWFFYRTTLENPITFACQSPCLIRIDRLDTNGIVHEYVLKAENIQSISVYPRQGYTEDWCRISVLNIAPEPFPPTRGINMRTPEPKPEPLITTPVLQSRAITNIYDYYPLGGQEDGTWSVLMSLARTKPYELEPGKESIPNKFGEFRVAYNKQAFSQTTWFATEGIARFHYNGHTTFGLREDIEQRPNTINLPWRLTLAGYTGHIENHESRWEGSIHSTFQIGPLYNLTRKSVLHPYVTVFGRWLTLDTSKAEPFTYIDHDLFTRYRADHKWGYAINMDYSYRPWIDTFLKTGFRLTSNEDLSPDNIGFRTTWQQLIYPARTEIGYAAKYFFADSDRKNNYIEHDVYVGVAIEKWVNGQSRLEFGTRIQIEWPHSDISGSVYLRWDFSQGRVYRDLLPTTTVFRSLRTALFPHDFNNRFE